MRIGKQLQTKNFKSLRSPSLLLVNTALDLSHGNHQISMSSYAHKTVKQFLKEAWKAMTSADHLQLKKTWKLSFHIFFMSSSVEFLTISYFLNI